MALSFSVPDTELSLTLENRRAEIVDNIMQGTPFLAAMSRYGGVRNESGGRELVGPVRMSKSTAGGSFSGYDILDVTPQDNETSYRFQWAAEYQSIALAWDEELKNAGPGKLLDILRVKTDDASDSMRDRFNRHLIQAQPGAGSKDPNSITELIDEDPTANPARTDSIGAISNANTWWRNKYTTGGAFTVADMNAMYNDVSDGSDAPTFGFTSDTVIEHYENSQQGLQRYGESRALDAGFDNIMYKKMPIFWDPQIGNTDEMYFINTKYLNLVIHSGGDFVTQPFVKPDNQAAKVAQILLLTQLICTNRRRCGTLHGITAPA